MSQLNWREYPANIPGPERHGSPLYLVRITYDGTEAIVYDWFIRRPSDEEIETRDLGTDYPDDYVGEWSENPDNVTHWIPASELLATVAPPLRHGAIFAVAEERARQVFGEDFDYKRDDAYVNGELVQAAVAYAQHAHNPKASVAVPYAWPWDPKWFKPTNPRRDLVKSAALIVAEIERLDRMPTDALPANQATIKQPSSIPAPDPLWWFSWYTTSGSDGVPGRRVIAFSDRHGLRRLGVALAVDSRETGVVLRLGDATYDSSDILWWRYAECDYQYRFMNPGGLPACEWTRFQDFNAYNFARTTWTDLDVEFRVLQVVENGEGD